MAPRGACHLFVTSKGIRVGTPSSRGARVAALAAAFTVLTPLSHSAFAAEPQLKLDTTKKTYIVQLVEAPVASYDGGTAGIPATKPAPGQKVKANSPNSKKYEAHLRNEQRKALRASGVKESAKKQEYTVAFNGFTAQLTQAEADALKSNKAIANVWEDEIRHADTVGTPEYLGMSGPGGVWQTQFGSGKGKKATDGIAEAGKGMVVGVIDTGIDPENPSFAPLAGGPAAPAGFVCDTGSDAAFECTNKIVGARYYGTAFGNTVAHDYDSPRDRNGHGSHTAGTAAGNHGVPMSIMGIDMGTGSGMAPAAQVAVYKALWQTADGNGSGTSSGLVAAIDDAVADGVDVINYSVSGSSTYVVTADELAFLAAAEAGVFVSTSAGNSGDTVGESSVAHNSPWTTTVAASTHSRGAEKKVTLGNGTTYDGIGVGGGAGPAPLVDSEEIPAAGRTAADARLCLPGSISAEEADGAIVICTRGSNARVEKADVVRDAGGVGMILANNTDAESLVADFHSIPSIHVSGTIGTAIKAYEDSTDAPTAEIHAHVPSKVDAPSMAGFSSYGPALAGEGDLLKPDITAPGVDIVAAYHEDPNTGEATFNQISGTSMSAPHIAGLGALLKQKYPTWSPMAIKSAMMTTARQTTDAGEPIQWAGGDATPLNFGAGEVVPAKSYNPGLVYDSDWQDWYNYACAINQLQLVGDAAYCAEAPKIDPSDLNYPSIAIGKLAGSQTVTRTVTNVSDKNQNYRAQIEAPAGTTVTVSPSTLKVKRGETATFQVTITRTDAPLGEYTHGALTWVTGAGKSESVRSPISVRPVALAAPGEVPGTGVAGSVDLQVTPGFTGTLGTDVDGLLPSTVRDLAVTKAEGTALDGYFFFTVPAGTKVTRVATWSDEVAAADIDLNVYRYNPTGTITNVGSSGNADSTESVTLNLTPGTYVAAVDLYSAEATVTAPVHVWNLGDADAGNMTVAPSPVEVTQGTPVTVTATWSGLDATQRYLGQVNFLEGAEVAGSTLVSVNP